MGKLREWQQQRRETARAAAAAARQRAASAASAAGTAAKRPRESRAAGDAGDMNAAERGRQAAKLGNARAASRMQRVRKALLEGFAGGGCCLAKRACVPAIERQSSGKAGEANADRPDAAPRRQRRGRRQGRRQQRQRQRQQQKKNQDQDQDQGAAEVGVRLGDFELLRCVGQGSFGHVFVATRAARGLGGAGGGTGPMTRAEAPGQAELFAVKVLNKSKVVQRHQLKHTMTEREIMLRFADHPFVLGLRCAFQTEAQLCLVSDFCPGGEVFFHLERAGRFDEATTRFYCAEVYDALVHLHSQGVAYRDLKCENLLLDARGHVKLADFGLSKLGVGEVSGAKTLCGSVSYMAPEMILCHRSQQWRGNNSTFGYMADWWTFGTFMFDMLVGQPPFFHPNRAAMFDRVLSNEPVPLPEAIPLQTSTRAVLAGLLQREPRRRLCSSARGGLGALYSHPFFAGVDWMRLRARQLQPPVVPFSREKQRSLRRGFRPWALRNFDHCFTGLTVAAALAETETPSADRGLGACVPDWDAPLVDSDATEQSQQVDADGDVFLSCAEEGPEFAAAVA